MNGRAAFPGGAAPGGARRDLPHAALDDAELRGLADALPAVVVRLDPGLALRYLNRHALEAFGPAPWPWWPPVREAAARAFESGRTESLRFEAELDGRPHRFVGHAAPQLEGSVVASVLAVAVDAGAAGPAETRHAKLLADERTARASAESATVARDQFLAIVSHELRSPLNGIKSWTHVLENQLRDADPTVKRAIAGIMIGVDHQVRLIEDLLDVTRAMSGTLGLLKQPVALLPVLAQAVESQRAVALERGLSLVTEYPLGDAQIHGDADRVRQIFVNLLSNAIKFTPSGGTVWISASREGNMARVEVRDDGAGIAPDFLPYVFDPFRQADARAHRRGQAGLGLGLALVQRLAELHGGYVSCESDGEGRGATFRVHLPLLRDTRLAVPLPREGLASRSGAALPSLRGIRVLLIDDQREARESLATLLTQAGAHVATAGSSQEAMAHLALSDDVEPEVVLCDIAMPGEDGYATLRRIRAWESAPARASRPPRPVVAITAFAQREDRLRALSEGFMAHLVKPVAPEELITAVATAARTGRP